MPRPWASGILILDPEVATCTRGYWGYRFMLAPPVDTMRLSARAWCWASSRVVVEWETFAAEKMMGCQRRWQTRGGASPCIWIAGSLFWKSTTGSSLRGQSPPAHCKRRMAGGLHNTTLGPPYLEGADGRR